MARENLLKVFAMRLVDDDPSEVLEIFNQGARHVGDQKKRTSEVYGEIKNSRTVPVFSHPSPRTPIPESLSAPIFLFAGS